MQNEQTRTYLATGTVLYSILVQFHFGQVTSRRLYVFRRVSSLWQSMLCEWLEFNMRVRASESTHFYVLPTPCFGFAPYGTCIDSSLQYANPLPAPIIRAGSVCAAMNALVCARCHPAPGSVVRAQSTPTWARRCHPQCHRQTHCRPLRDVTTHRRSA